MYYTKCVSNHGFTFAVKNFSDKHSADGKAHGIVGIVHAIPPLFFSALGADQGLS